MTSMTKKDQITQIRRRLATLIFLNVDTNQEVVRAASRLLVAAKVDPSGDTLLEIISNMTDPLDKKWYVKQETMEEILRYIVFDSKKQNIGLFNSWEASFFASSYKDAVKQMLFIMFGEFPERGKSFGTRCRTIESIDQYDHHFKALLTVGHPLSKDPGPIGRLAIALGVKKQRPTDESVTIKFTYSQLSIHRCGNSWTINYEVKL